MNQPFTIRRSSERHSTAKEAATIALKGKTLDTRALFDRYEDISLLKRKQISFFQRCY
jgi:hypothetical protein